jgi:hypothetical protein
MEPRPTKTPCPPDLAPGARASISEADWFAALEAGEPLHQWSNVLLLDEGHGGCVRAYVRDDSPGRRHQCLRLDGLRSRAARTAVAEIEAASRALADLITRHQGQASMTPAELAEEQAASEAFTHLADRVYAELLGG